MDANEYALKVGPAHKSLGVAIRKAQWLGKGKAKPISTASAGIPSVSVAVVHEPPAAAMLVMSAAPPVPPLVAELRSRANTSVAEIALPAQALPEAPVPMPVAETKALGHEHEDILVFGARRYRVRGLAKNLSLRDAQDQYPRCAPHSMAGARPTCNAVHVDTFDLYRRAQRQRS